MRHATYLFPLAGGLIGYFIGSAFLDLPTWSALIVAALAVVHVAWG